MDNFVSIEETVEYGWHISAYVIAILAIGIVGTVIGVVYSDSLVGAVIAVVSIVIMVVSLMGLGYKLIADAVARGIELGDRR